HNEGVSVADYYTTAGILTHGTDFISIDKYGVDGGSEQKNDNPGDSTWFWNAEHWGNYLSYAKTLHERTAMPVMLWQLPVGHIDHSLAQDPYHPGQVFPDLGDTPRHWEDSAPDFFLGDTFVPGAGNRYAWFSQNRGSDPAITLLPDNQTITWGSHMVAARDAGVNIMLFGDGIGNSTSGRGQANTDAFWWISRAQVYYTNPVPLSP
ncbi:MAG: Chitinase, partial [Verrucomicrobiaceae bacterium]|nr:Chitinase [Verrucomicrobiaceae bacterium]